MPTVLNDDQREQRSGFTNFLFRAAVTGLITIGILKSTEDGADKFRENAPASPIPPTEQKKDNAVPADSIQQNQPQKKIKAHKKNKENSGEFRQELKHFNDKKYAFLDKTHVQQPDKIHELYDVTPVGGASQSKAK